MRGNALRPSPPRAMSLYLPCPMLAVPTPYALAQPAFRFRALAALAGRAALGGERETALGVLLAARLAATLLPPDAIAPEARAERASAARTWLSSLALPAGVRPSLARVIEASAGDDSAALAAAVEKAAETAARLLDAASAAELSMLVRALRNE